MRFSFPGKRAILALLNLPLYTPAAVMGLGLLLVYNLVYHIQQSTFGLIAAMTMGTFGLALMPIIVSLKDLPPAFEEAFASVRPAIIELRMDPEMITTRTTLSAIRQQAEAATEKARA